MKESLKLLGVESSGIEANIAILQAKKNEEEVESYLNEALDPLEKEKYLKELLKSKPIGFIKAKRVLADLLKEKELEYSIDLIMSASLSSPVDPENYLLFAEIASHYNALTLARDAVTTVKWLLPDDDVNVHERANLLDESLLKKIKTKVDDNSKNKFWRNKFIDKFWVLEKLYLQASYKELIEYSFKLLEVFRNDLTNYLVVYKALALLSDKEALQKFIEYINNAFLSDELNRNLLLGMVYYSLSDLNNSISYLNNALKINRMHPRALFYLSLNHLMQGNIRDFIKTSNMILPESEVKFIALYFISSVMSNITMPKNIFPDHKNVAKQVAKIISSLLKNKKNDIVLLIVDQFEKLDYYAVLPFLQLYLADVFIRTNMLKNAKEILVGVNNPEVHRLNAWIYRLEGEDKLAETELIEYRKNISLDSDVNYFFQTINLQLPSKSPEDTEEIFKYLNDSYRQTGDLIKQFDLEYGVNAMTCIEMGCQDCCKKTFPLVTYTEYLYMRKWLDKQEESFKREISESSKKIVDVYKERYKKEPPFIIGEKFDLKKEYPYEFYFTCPFLGDNKCNVYEARPFTCRGYGYSSFTGITFKGCNYFFEQFKKGNMLDNIRKVIDARSFFNFTKLTDEKLIGKKVRAPLPVWFVTSHEETLKRIEKALKLSN